VPSTVCPGGLNRNEGHHVGVALLKYKSMDLKSVFIKKISEKRLWNDERVRGSGVPSIVSYSGVNCRGLRRSIA